MAGKTILCVKFNLYFLTMDNKPEQSLSRYNFQGAGAGAVQTRLSNQNNFKFTDPESKLTLIHMLPGTGAETGITSAFNSNRSQSRKRNTFPEQELHSSKYL